VRNAVAGAARDSPFLQPGLFAAAEMVACSVQAGAELSAAGREAGAYTRPLFSST